MPVLSNSKYEQMFWLARWCNGFLRLYTSCGSWGIGMYEQERAVKAFTLHIGWFRSSRSHTDYGMCPRCFDLARMYYVSSWGGHFHWSTCKISAFSFQPLNDTWKISNCYVFSWSVQELQAIWKSTDIYIQNRLCGTFHLRWTTADIFT